jgi:hypothetical protein
MSSDTIPNPVADLKRAMARKRRSVAVEKYNFPPPKWKPRIPEISEEELRALMAKMKSHLRDLNVVDLCTTKTTWLDERDVAKRWGMKASEIRKLRWSSKIGLGWSSYDKCIRCKLHDLRAFEQRFKR